MLNMDNEQPNAPPRPSWLDENTIGFWEPDELFIEWMNFLITLWDHVDYL